MVGITVTHNNTHWKLCDGCGRYIRIDLLSYEHPTGEFKYGRNLCYWCALHSLNDVLFFATSA
jgi:hypothetical protein